MHEILLKFCQHCMLYVYIQQKYRSNVIQGLQDTRHFVLHGEKWIKGMEVYPNTILSHYHNDDDDDDDDDDSDDDDDDNVDDDDDFIS